jgi:hypothetical protein
MSTALWHPKDRPDDAAVFKRGHWNGFRARSGSHLDGVDKFRYSTGLSGEEIYRPWVLTTG